MTLSDFYYAVKIEVKSRTPFPVLEFFFLLFVFLFLSSIITQSTYNGSALGMELIRVGYISIAQITWSMTLSVTLLILSLVFAVFISISVTGEYESGTMATRLTLPITRLQYLGAKCLVYGIFSIAVLLGSFFIVFALTPYVLAPGEVLKLVLVWISSVVFFLALCLFIAVNTRKVSISLFTSLITLIPLTYVFSRLEEPIVYFFNPGNILLATDPLEGLVWGIICRLIVGLIVLGLSFYRFLTIDILSGED